VAVNVTISPTVIETLSGVTVSESCGLSEGFGVAVGVGVGVGVGLGVGVALGTGEGVVVGPGLGDPVEVALELNIPSKVSQFAGWGSKSPNPLIFLSKE